MQISFEQADLTNEWIGFKYKLREILVRIKYGFWILIDPFDYPKGDNLVDQISQLPKKYALRAIEYFLAVEFHEYDIEASTQDLGKYTPKQRDNFIKFLECQNKTTLELELLKDRLENE